MLWLGLWLFCIVLCIVLLWPLVMQIEIIFIMSGKCHDFYMIPFRFLLKKYNLRLETTLTDLCNKIPHNIAPISVRTYFLKGLINYGMAFSVPKIRTIFFQRSFMDYLNDDELKHVLAHEIYHIESKHIGLPLERWEFEADAFATKLTSIHIGIAVLTKTLDFNNIEIEKADDIDRRIKKLQITHAS